jgi:hypothetical protein
MYRGGRGNGNAFSARLLFAINKTQREKNMTSFVKSLHDWWHATTNVVSSAVSSAQQAIAEAKAKHKTEEEERVNIIMAVKNVDKETAQELLAEYNRKRWLPDDVNQAVTQVYTEDEFDVKAVANTPQDLLWKQTHTTTTNLNPANTPVSAAAVAISNTDANTEPVVNDVTMAWAAVEKTANTPTPNAATSTEVPPVKAPSTIEPQK